METLFNEDWSLWGPSEAALSWPEGLLDSSGWISKPGEELLADGTKPEAGYEDLWAPLVDLVDDAEFNEWMEIKMDVEDLSAFSASLASVEPLPPPTAPPPADELLGPLKVELPECNITSTVTNEAAILFSSMLESSSPLSPAASPIPDRPSSRSSSSAESSLDYTSSGPPSVADADLLSLWLTTTATESNPESTGNSPQRARKSPRRPSRLKTVSGGADKKVRKRDQNRDAATRYREKKRAEAEILRHEEEKFEKKNNELRDRADGLSAEIKYLKGLLKELLEARQK